MNLQLVRHSYTPEATLGYLLASDLRLATLEEAWHNDPDGPGGQRREGALVESCVPDGTYQLVPHNGTHWQNVWALTNPRLGVYHLPDEIPAGQRWGRSAVLIHAGNSTGDIEGCIAVGNRHGRELNKPWIYEAQVALDRLRAVLGRNETHTLTIRPIAGVIELAA